MLVELVRDLSYTYVSPITRRKYVLSRNAPCEIDDRDISFVARSAPIVPASGSERSCLRAAHRGVFQFQRYAIDNGLPLIPKDLSGQKVILVRAGGIGDVLFLGPVVSALVKRGAIVSLAVASQHQPLASLIQGVSEVVSVTRFVPEDYDFVLKMQGVIERNSLAQNLHAVDACLQWLGLDTTEKVARLRIPKRYSDWAEEWFEKRKMNPERVIAIHSRASSPLRTWKRSSTEQLIEELAKRDFDVIFFDSIPIDLKPNERLVNLSGYTSILETVALLSRVGLFVGVDSGLLHIAGSLETPLLLLATSFDPLLRLRYYKKYTALWGRPSCSPCFHHVVGLCKHLDKSSVPVCSNLITTKRVVEEVENIFTSDYQWFRVNEVRSASHNREKSKSEVKTGSC